MNKQLNFTIELELIQKNIQSQLDAIKKQLDSMQASATNAGKEMQNATGEASQKVEDLTEKLKDAGKAGATAGNDAGEALKKTGKDAEDASEKVQSSTERIRNALEGVQVMAFVQNFQSVAMGVDSLAQPAMRFEQSMHDLSAITGIVGKELDDLGKQARRFGRESGLGAEGAAESYKILASQIQVDKIGMEGLNALQAKTITLAQAAGMSMADAANSLAGTLNQFGMAVDQSGRVINVLAAGSKYGAAEITELAQSFKVTGAVAAGFGISVEQTAGALEVLSKNNLKGAEAGTALRNVLLSMKTTLGMDIGEMGLPNALKQLQPMLSDTTLLAKTFGKENVAAAQFLISHADAVDEMTGKLTDTNTAYEQAAVATDTWQHKQEVAKATMEDFLITITNATGGLMPFVATAGKMLVPFAQLAPLISALQKPMNALIGGLGSLVVTLSKMSAAEMLLAAKTKIVTVAKAAWTAVQWALNAALNANPIGAVVIAITALVGAVVYAYKHSDSFKKSVDRLWQGLKNVWELVKAKLSPIFEKLGAVIKALLPYIKAFGKFLIEYILWPVRAVIGAVTWVLEKLGLLSEEEAKAGQAAGEMSRSVNNSKTSIENQGNAAATAAAQTNAYANALKNLGMVDLSSSFDKSSADEVMSQRFADMKRKSQLTLKQIGESIQQLNDIVANTTANSPEQKRALVMLNAYKRLEAQRKRALGLDGASGGGTATSEKKKITDLRTIEGLQNRIQDLQAKQKRQSLEEAIITERQINAMQKRLEVMQDALKHTTIEKVKIDLKPIKGGLLAHLMESEETEKAVAKKKLQPIIDKLGLLKPKTIEPMLSPLDAYQKKLQQVQKKMQPLTSTVGQLGGAMRGLAGIVGQGAAAWLSWGANVIDAVSQALPQLATLFSASAATSGAEAAKSVAGIPIVGPVMAVSAIASVLGAIMAIPRPFAEGGIVGGPTYALIGEYAGAANNPEVVAPLNKLRDMLAPNERSGSSQVSFRISGRDLIGVLKNEQHHRKLV